MDEPVILKEQLYREAISDPLTRLFSRRHFETQLQEADIDPTLRPDQVDLATYAKISNMITV